MSRRESGVRPGIILLGLAAGLLACDVNGRRAVADSTPQSGGDGVTDRAACRNRGCEIRLSHVAAFSDSTVEGQLSNIATAAPDSRGRFIVAGINRILVYDARGRLTGAVGQRGQGPGEFERLVYAIIGRGDSIYAYDIASRRLTVLSPELRFVRWVATRHGPRFQLRDGSFLVEQQISGPPHANHPMHRMLADGSIAGSFGASGLTYHPDIQLRIDRGVGPGRDGSIWAVALGRYVLERYDPVSGARLDSVVVTSPWFRESDRFGNDVRGRPSPILEHVWEDSLGFLWVLGREADPEWRPAPADAHESSHDRDAIYDWILEVVDPDDARVVASRRIPTYPRVRHPAYSMITLGPDSTEVTHHIWRLSLASKRQP